MKLVTTTSAAESYKYYLTIITCVPIHSDLIRHQQVHAGLGILTYLRREHLGP